MRVISKEYGLSRLQALNLHTDRLVVARLQDKCLSHRCVCARKHQDHCTKAWRTITDVCVKVSIVCYCADNQCSNRVDTCALHRVPMRHAVSSRRPYSEYLKAVLDWRYCKPKGECAVLSLRALLAPCKGHWGTYG
eukprot:6174514-Pleurochrysis_carterae.AAC.1